MCGRFSLFAAMKDVEERLDARFVDPYERRYNAAPGQHLHVVRDVAPDRIVTAEWGLQPPWAETRADAGFVNARVETAAEKRSFAAAMAGAGGAGTEATAGRCLVPADGYYEWADADGGRQPYRLHVPDQDLFAMAGLWTRWSPRRRQSGLAEFGEDAEGRNGAGGRADDEASEDGAGGRADDEAGEDGAGRRGEDNDGERDDRTVETFAILTTEPNDVAREVHDRMPAILTPDEQADWLGSGMGRARTLLGPYDGRLEAYTVSHEVNDPANDRPSVVQPIDG